MLACLKKDYYTIWGYCRYLLFAIGLFMVLPYISNDTEASFYAIYPRLFAGMIPLTIYTYDEREHWCTYCSTLPISRKTYVLAKYLLGILLTLSVSAINGAMDLLFTMLGRKGAELSLGMGIAMSLLMSGFTMPFVYRFGAEKGRIVYLIAVGAGAVLSMSVLSAPPAVEAGNDLILLLFALALYVLSALLSVRFYKKREL